MVREPVELEDARPGRALRPDARDPRSRRPHGRRGRAGKPAAPDLASHARDEPLARAPAPRRPGRRRRDEQGRHLRRRWDQGHDDHAEHSAGDWNPGGETTLYLGEPVGFVVELENGFRFYFAGDTAAFGDMRYIGELYAPDVALLPIGGHYTMGPTEAALAVELLGVKHVIPMHYGTFPALAGTPDELRAALADRGLGDVEVLAPAVGGSVS